MGKPCNVPGCMENAVFSPRGLDVNLKCFKHRSREMVPCSEEFCEFPLCRIRLVRRFNPFFCAAHAHQQRVLQLKTPIRNRPSESEAALTLCMIARTPRPGGTKAVSPQPSGPGGPGGPRKLLKLVTS